MAKPGNKPKWIWIAGASHAEDCYIRARRTFTLGSKPASARLRVTAFSNYFLYVNGRYVGCGPAPSSLEEPLVDVYTEADLPLVRGRNVIAVLAHNTYVGLPRAPRAPGGLWLELVMTGSRGRRETIVSDGLWRVAPAEDFSRRAPRIYWTAGFAEVRDMRREPRGWTTAAFPDRRWAAADRVRPEGADGAAPPQPRDRPTARLAETFVAPAAVAQRGCTRWRKGLTAIPFEFTVPNPAHGEFYAATFVRSRTRQKARLVFDCDEAAAVYVNNRQALRQGYKEEFIRWLGEEEQNDYVGIHRGQGQRAETAEVTLEPQWNSVGVVIYDPGTSWGFALRFEDPRTGEVIPLEFTPDQMSRELADWHVVMEQLCPCGDGSLPETPGPNSRTFPDPAYQAAWEIRKVGGRAARGAASIVAGKKPGGACVLQEGEFVLYDLGDEWVGRVELDVEGPAGAILDVGWAEGLDARGDLPAVHRGMRRADRLILRGQRQTVRFLNRRAMRYLELVARTGGGAVRVYRAGVAATLRLAEPPPVPQSDDAALAGAMKIIGRTVEVCVQDTLEGSPAREGEQSVASAFFLSQAERVLSGRIDMGDEALRSFAADQAGDGFFRAVVPAGTQHVIPDWNLLWIIWMADHVLWTGNRALAEDLYPVAERCLDWTASFRDAHGLPENRPDRSPWWLMLDLSPIDKHGVATAWAGLYARALGATADLAEFLGHEDAAEHGRAEVAAIAEAARRRLWDEGRGLFADGRHFEHLSREASAATNYYALYGRLATDEQAQRILAQLWQDDRNESAEWGTRENPYVKYFALETLFERGQADRALAIIRRYWGAMAREGLTTVPEAYPLSTKKGPGPSFDGAAEGPYGGPVPEVLCHGWGVHPAALVAKWVLGVRPGKPGFDLLDLAPMPGETRHICGRVWTPKGFVEVAIRRKAGRREVHATVPENLPYKLDRRHLAAGDEVKIVGGTPVT